MPATLRWLLRLVPMNPIVVRLVQGGSRRSRHMLIRSVYLALLIAVLMTMLLPQRGTLTYQALAVSGAHAFEIVAYLQIALICILSPVFMAGAIAQESNPRTWEVLLTTPLSAAQMVLGQLFGRLFFILALLIASLPLFAITQYFGGVPGSSILLSYAVAASAALVVGAIAVALAVNRLAGRRAVFAFYVAVVTYLALTIAVDASIGAGRVSWVTALNPFLALKALLNPSGYPRPDVLELASMPGLKRFWLGNPVAAWCIVSGGMSLVLIFISTFTVRTIGASIGSIPWYRRAFGLGAKGASARPPRPVGMNPIAWREATARQATLPKMVMRWAFIGSGALWGLAVILYYHGGAINHATFRETILMTVWTELVVIVLVAINTSATAISKEREDGTLDLLLTTPLTPREYLGGKIRGLVMYLLPLLAVPLGTVAAAAIYVLAGGLGRVDGVTSNDLIRTASVDVPVILPEAAVVVPLVTLPFTAFCVVVGLQWSLKSKGTIGSVVATVGMVGIIAGIVGLCGWQAGASMSVVGPALSASTPLTALFSCVKTAAAFTDQNIDGPNDLIVARVSLSIGAVIAAVVYSLIVLGIRTNMVKNFDRETRRLAGAR
ncbi:MAG: ABC transporter permease subunit [Phycisphaerae bacterium]|nr:ABC transporter permease subunit [Phycisphaerae bacterium]